MIEHPYHDIRGEEWLRGNLHTHSTRSDGARDVQTVIDDYASRGYDYLMISDHDIYTSIEDHAQWQSGRMLLIPGNEITRNGPHLLHVAADRFVAPDKDRQAVINEVASGTGFVIVNHPDWQAGFNHCSLEHLRNWDGYQGIEIYNGVIGRLNGSPYALRKWETLLSDGRRVWGYANDDSHAVQDVGLGWNVVSVKERSVESVVEALRTGRFYASTGVEITGISVDDRRIRIETSNAERIIGHSDWGHRFAVVDGNTIDVEVPDTATYVRFECWGRGEQFAWTQPFFQQVSTSAGT
ncbi:MAG: CehA/McbA family metallohydrolase [Armatimonadota bacterium]